MGGGDFIPSRDVYRKQLGLHGETQRERVINNAQNDISKNVVVSPSYKIVMVNDVKQQALEIVATQTDNKKRFTTMPNEEVALGDVLEWNSMHWLVTKVDFDDEIVRRGEIEQCNRIIKWQNAKSLEIISRWCLCTKPYTSNIEEGKIISTSNREFKIQLPYDNETRLLDLGKRFLLEEIGGKAKAYKMTSVDTLTNRYEDIAGGFLIWNVEQDTSDKHTDNEELMIADYIDPVAPPVPPPDPDPTLLKCEILGRSDIKIGGSPRKYTARFFDADGVTEITDGSVTAVWDFVTDPAHAEFFKCIPNGNSISICVPDSSATGGLTGVLRLTDAAGAYQPAELVVEAVVM